MKSSSKKKWEMPKFLVQVLIARQWTDGYEAECEIFLKKIENIPF